MYMHVLYVHVIYMQVEDYPHIAYYNSSSGQWAEVQEKNFQNIIARALGQ